MISLAEDRACVDMGTTATQPPRRNGLGLVLIILAALLVFAHGCHGDEDNELFGMLGERGNPPHGSISGPACKPHQPLPRLLS
jgi:hypothetical protein